MILYTTDGCFSGTGKETSQYRPDHAILTTFSTGGARQAFPLHSKWASPYPGRHTSKPSPYIRGTQKYAASGARGGLPQLQKPRR